MKVKNLIIGAGPAGLAVAGRCSKAGVPYTIIEASDRAAVSWHRHYERLHLHTVSQWSHLPHMPFPEDFPKYVPRQRLVDYFQSYVEHFDIQPRYNQTVVSIKKGDSDQWHVVTNDTEYQAENVVLCTGVNRVPFSPTWPGMDTYEGEIIHSRQYKNAKPFVGHKVMVVGMGNTGAELALDLSEHDIETSICVRGKVSIVPRDLHGRAVQETSKKLAKLPFGLGDWLGTQIRRLHYGNLSKYGLHEPKLHPAEQLRTTGKTPVIDIGTIKAIKEGKIKVVPGIQHFEKNRVHFVDGTSIEVDRIILATGYRSGIQEFLPNVTAFLDKHGYPRQCVGDGQLAGLYFVGFDNYKLGGILGTIYNDSETVVGQLSK